LAFGFTGESFRAVIFVDFPMFDIFTHQQEMTFGICLELGLGLLMDDLSVVVQCTNHTCSAFFISDTGYEKCSFVVVKVSKCQQLFSMIFLNFRLFAVIPNSSEVLTSGRL